MRFVGKLTFAVCCLALLPGCAAAPAGDQSKSATSTRAAMTTATGVLPDSFAGVWFVTAVYPTGSTRGSAADRHIGAAVLLRRDDVSDVNGQRCGNPDFAADNVTGAVAGLKMPITGDMARLQVSCGGKPFASLLQVAGKRLPKTAGSAGSALLDGATPALLAQRPEAVYLLERAEQVLYRQAAVGTAQALAADRNPSPKPVSGRDKAKAAPKVTEHMLVAPAKGSTAVSKPAVAAKPAPKMNSRTASADGGSASGKASAQKAMPTSEQIAAKTPPAKATSKAPKPGEAIHLASYNGLGTAAHGWEILRAKYTKPAPLKPLYVSVDITGKAMIRLFATGATEVKLKQICSDLQAKRAYCALHP